MISKNAKIAIVAAVCAIALFSAWAIYSFSVSSDSEVTYDDVETIDGLTVTYVSGTAGACTLAKNSDDEYTVTFDGLSEDSVYELSGILKGNIVVDCQDNGLELRLNGMNISSKKAAPMKTNSCGNLTITVVDGTKNRISDFREDHESTYAIISSSEMEIAGEGTLWVESTHNGGISSSGNIRLDASNVSVESRLDSIVSAENVTVTADSFTAMSHAGTGVLGVDVTIDGSSDSVSATVLSCAMGIAASDDLEVKGDVNLKVQTSDMSKRPERTDVYVGYSNLNFTFSLKVQSASGTTWVNPSGDPTLVHRAMAKSYVYEFEVPKDAETFEIYAYSSSQVQGQDSSYYSKSASIPKEFGRTSLLITQCAFGTEIKFVPADYGGPGMPDMGESNTIGLSAGNDLSITGAKVTVRAEGSALMAQNGNITALDTNLTAFSRFDTVKAGNDVSMTNGKIVLFSEGNEGFVLSYGGELTFDSSYLVGTCSQSTRTEEKLSKISETVETSSTTLQGPDAGTYLTTTVDGKTVCVVTIPDGTTGAPPRDMNAPMGDKNQQNGASERMMAPTAPDGMMPASTLAFFLGSDAANLAVSTETSYTLDENGVYWS